MKILIAEDEEYNQMVVQAMVEILYPDVAITIVENGAEALEKLASEPFDLLLTDVDMPVMNGYILVDEIKKLGLILPMICVTAFAISGDREKLLLHGFDNYISKPIDMDEMKRVLDNYINA
ncbi:MAG: response regulator [Sulfuricurvum sp.]|uniref:response regulator n=1 Tax=Sulfuricurvum sp. TaxID=2025608 RepID=UPI00262D6720|nr:response regulator [Sulfuricurvum sp.]MDD2828379.1 response regulator [Sulfuricurvum sp.]MDD4949384.1 response regulator [Sulfuricurvum sp.]